MSDRGTELVLEIGVWPAGGTDGVSATGVSVPATGVSVSATGVSVPATGVSVPATGVSVPATVTISQ